MAAAVLHAAGGHWVNNMQMRANCRNIHKTIAITAQQAAPPAGCDQGGRIALKLESRVKVKQKLVV